MELGPISEKPNRGIFQYSLSQEEDLLAHLDDCSHTLQSYVDSLDKQWHNRTEVRGFDFDHKENFYED